MAYRILLVDDELDILEFVGYNLMREGYEVYTATDGEQAVARALEVEPHLILLDVMMPRMDGITACQRIRSHPRIADTLIIFLTARSEEESQIEGFEAGADDYISKPIKMKVLVSRIKAVFKRIDPPSEGAACQGVVIDRERHVVWLDGEQVVLPRKEYNLLELLSSRPGRLFTREEIYDQVWGNEVVVGERTIDVHVRNLRKKIGEERIVTVKGVGYKYEEPSAE